MIPPMPSPWTARAMSMWPGFTGSSDFPGVGAGLGRQHLCLDSVKPLWRSSMRILSRLLAATFLGGEVRGEGADVLTLDSAG